ncbi:MAG: GUN4 domain-containing protein, partial [Coleofasciculus sp. C2-GNP5-27]
IQKRIWESVGGTPDADYRTVCYFGNHVGWRRSGRWLSYGNRTFNHLSPKGHLPYLCFQIKLPDLNLLEFAELFNFEEGLERVRDFGVNRLFNLVQKCSL